MINGTQADEFLKVEKVSKQKMKEVDAQHLLFFGVRGLRSSTALGLRGYVVRLVCEYIY